MRFCDSSVVLSWLVEDSHSRQADAWLTENPLALCISSLVELEVRNRLRSLSLNRDLSEEVAREAQYALSQLITLGPLRCIHLRDTKSLVAESLRLLDHFSPAIPHGTLDVVTSPVPCFSNPRPFLRSIRISVPSRLPQE